MDECIELMQSQGDDSMLEAEGPLDEEAKFPKYETIHRQTDSDSNTPLWSARADAGSPMDIEGNLAGR